MYIHLYYNMIYIICKSQLLEEGAIIRNKEFSNDSSEFAKRVGCIYSNPIPRFSLPHVFIIIQVFTWVTWPQYCSDFIRGVNEREKIWVWYTIMIVEGSARHTAFLYQCILSTANKYCTLTLQYHTHTHTQL